MFKVLYGERLLLRNDLSFPQSEVLHAQVLFGERLLLRNDLSFPVLRIQ